MRRKPPPPMTLGDKFRAALARETITPAKYALAFLGAFLSSGIATAAINPSETRVHTPPTNPDLTEIFQKVTNLPAPISGNRITLPSKISRAAFIKDFAQTQFGVGRSRLYEANLRSAIRLMGYSGQDVDYILRDLTSGKDKTTKLLDFTDKYFNRLQQTYADIQAASAISGIRAKELKTICLAETNGNIFLTPGTSSALGCFQILEKTMHTYARRYLNDERLPTPYRAMLREGLAELKAGKPQFISDLRLNTTLTAAMVGFEMQRVGVTTAREYYPFHFAGEGGMRKLKEMPSGAIAAKEMPAAAKANKSVFYTKDAKEKYAIARTAEQVLAELDRRAQNALTGTQKLMGLIENGDTLVAVLHQKNGNQAPSLPSPSN